MFPSRRASRRDPPRRRLARPGPVLGGLDPVADGVADDVQQGLVQPIQQGTIRAGLLADELDLDRSSLDPRGVAGDADQPLKEAMNRNDADVLERSQTRRLSRARASPSSAIGMAASRAVEASAARSSACSVSRRMPPARLPSSPPVSGEHSEGDGTAISNRSMLVRRR